MQRLLLLGLLLTPACLAAQSNTGVISGRVLRASGAPAAGIRVSALDAQLDTQSRTKDPNAMTIVSLAQTDASGHYRLEGIPPGRYIVMIGRFDLPTYYPGVGEMEKATRTNVSAGGTVTGIDFRLPPAVSGRIRRTHDGNTERTSVLLVSTTNFNVRLRAFSNVDGSFRFDEVPPGMYDVIPGSEVREVLAQPVTINVSDHDLTGVEIMLFARGATSISVEVDGGGLLPRATLAFVPLDSGRCRLITNDGKPIQETSEDCFPTILITKRSLLLRPVEGQYRFSLSGLPPGHVVRSIVSGDIDLLANPFTVKPDVTDRIVITIGVASPPPGVRVSGRVRDEAVPFLVAGVTRVSLLPTGVPSPLEKYSGSLETDVKADGSFDFPMVPPGAYLAILGTLPIPPIPVTVANRELNDVDIVVPPMREVAGSFSIDGAVPTPVAPRLVFGLRNPDNVEIPPVMVSTFCDGTFRALLPEGDFTLAVTTEMLTVKSTNFGGADVLQGPVNIVAGGAEEFRIELSSGNAGILAGSFGIYCEASRGRGRFRIPTLAQPGLPSPLPTQLPTPIQIPTEPAALFAPSPPPPVRP